MPRKGSLKAFAEARKLEKLELQILLEFRRHSPETAAAFPVSLQQWGGPVEVNGVYATNLGEFFFIDRSARGPLKVKLLETPRALELIDLLDRMGVKGNRTRLSSLRYAEAFRPSPVAGLLPPPKPEN